MTRFLSAAGLAVYAIAVSTAFPSVQEAWDDLGGLVPAAVAAEAGTETGSAAADATTEPAGPGEIARSRLEWKADRDGELMEDASVAEPFAVLNPA